MKNNIKRIFIKNKASDTEKYIIVVRENGIEKIESDLNKRYLELVKEINEQLYNNKMDLKSLRDVLIDSNVISYVDSKFISKIEYDEKNVNVYRNFNDKSDERYSTDGDSEDLEEDLEYLRDLYNSYKKSLMRQFEIDFDDMYLSEEELKKLNDFFKLEEKDLENLGLLNVKKQKAVKNLNVRSKNILALVVAMAIGFGTGGFVLGNMNKNKKEEAPKNQYVSTTKTPKITSTPYDSNTKTEVELPNITAKPTSVPTATPTIVPTATPVTPTATITPKLVLSDMDLGLNGKEIVIDVTPELLTYHYIGDKDYEDSTDALTMLSLEQMSEIGSILQNPANKTENYFGSLIYFENKFTNPEDIGYVKYFSDIRNEVIYQSYFIRDYEQAEKYVVAGNYEVIRCLVDNEPVPVEINGEIVPVCFSDLSHEAQEVVFNLAYSLQISLAYEKFMYNGTVYDQNAMYELLEIVNNSISHSK